MLLVTKTLAQRPGSGIGSFDGIRCVALGGDLRYAKRNKHFEFLPVARFTFGFGQHHQLEGAFEITDRLHIGITIVCTVASATPLLDRDLTEPGHLRVLSY